MIAMTKREFAEKQKEFNNELRSIILAVKEIVRDEVGAAGCADSTKAFIPSADPNNLDQISKSLELILQQLGSLKFRVRKNAKEFYQI